MIRFTQPHRFAAGASTPPLWVDAEKPVVPGIPNIIIDTTPSEDTITAEQDLVFRTLLPKVSTALTRKSHKSVINKLLSEHLDPEEMKLVTFIASGKHQLGTGIYVVAGNAQFEATGEGVIFACGRAKGIVRGTFRLYATDHVEVRLYDRVVAFLTGHAHLASSNDTVRGTAEGKVIGKVNGQSYWQVSGHVYFDAFDNASVSGTDNANLRAFGNSQIRASGKAHAKLSGKATGWIEEEATYEASGESVCYYKDSAQGKRLTHEARVYHVEIADVFRFGNWPDF